MRPPNDFADSYSSSADAVRGLRALADALEAQAAAYPFVKWDIRISYWNPAWTVPSKGGEPIRIGDTFRGVSCAKQ